MSINNITACLRMFAAAAAASTNGLHDTIFNNASFLTHCQSLEHDLSLLEHASHADQPGPLSVHM